MTKQVRFWGPAVRYQKRLAVQRTKHSALVGNALARRDGFRSGYLLSVCCRMGREDLGGR